MKRAALPLLAAVLLAACGGGQDAAAAGTSPTHPPAAPTLLAETSSAQAGDARIGATVLVLALPGPVLDLAQPARVRLRLAGSLQQAAHYGAQAVASVALSQPAATGASSLPATLQPLAPTSVPISYDVWLQLPAGTHALVAQITVRAFDANGLATSALAKASAQADWLVELAP